MASTQSITILLNQWMKGDLSVEDQLINNIYPLLRDVAHKQVVKASDKRINTTLIVNELYLKLRKTNKLHVQDKGHFLALSAKLIRQIVVDIIRKENSLKRGNIYKKITLSDGNAIADKSNEINIDWLNLHTLLNELEEIDPDSVKIIELRFFAGQSIPETAKILGTSTATISRNWKFAKSWLINRLNE